ncbi:hypothetical protein OJJOAM_002926 [Cupriavidus sp. H18C1]
MQLRLEGIAQQAGSQVHLYPMSLAPVPGAVTILLGATQAGKTSLMRVMAGLDRPSAGRVLVDDADVTGMPVRQRNVSMVYQQFINYPSLTVFDNIASPLRLRGAAEIDRQVRALARAAAYRPSARALSRRAVRRPAAARCAGAGAGQGRAADAAGRAAGQPRLQAARGTAGGTGPAVRAGRRHRDLRDHRAGRGAAARRPYRGARCRRVAAIRADRRGLPLSRLAARGARLQRSADEPDRGRMARRRRASAGRHRCGAAAR